MKHLKTIKQYSILEGISTSGVYLRIKRGKLKFKLVDGRKYVFINSDNSIKKPRIIIRNNDEHKIALKRLEILLDIELQGLINENEKKEADLLVKSISNYEEKHHSF